MSLIGDLFQIKERWNSMDRKEKAICLFLSFMAAFVLSFTFLDRVNQAFRIIMDRNATEEIRVLLGVVIMFLSNFDVKLILAFLVAFAIFSVSLVYLLDKLEKERTKTKDYRKNVLIEYEGLLKFLAGDTKYVKSEVKINWRQESFDSIINRISSTEHFSKQPSEDVKDKLRDVGRKLRDGFE